ncbi:hypothetical protein CspHIS471_0402280 [Cutaneotrichosporon sp. HIS471]|nr:hypothetical protein CspHIS471_0402280 [Cutaneotrichosporon sp. HIS471]
MSNRSNSLMASDTNSANTAVIPDNNQYNSVMTPLTDVGVDNLFNQCVDEAMAPLLVNRPPFFKVLQSYVQGRQVAMRNEIVATLLSKYEVLRTSLETGREVETTLKLKVDEYVSHHLSRLSTALPTVISAIDRNFVNQVKGDAMTIDYHHPKIRRLIVAAPVNNPSKVLKPLTSELSIHCENALTTLWYPLLSEIVAETKELATQAMEDTLQETFPTLVWP